MFGGVQIRLELEQTQVDRLRPVQHLLLQQRFNAVHASYTFITIDILCCEMEIH